MSIKGFPSSQKLPLGTGITNEFVTVVPSDEYRYSLDSNRPLFRVNSSTVPRTAAANTGNIDGMTWVYDTSTPAKKGDFVRFEDGNAQFIELPIVKVETNRFMLGSYLANPPAAGNTFYILRSVSSLVNSDGSSSTALPTGAATSANQTNGNQLTQITDGSGASVTVHNISTTMNGGDKALVTMSAIHGKNGGSYLDLLCDATGILSTNVQNFPATQTVSGTVAATQSGTWGVGLNAGTNLVGKVGIDQTTNGTTNAVYVNNFPATQPVSGSVSVSNFPATQAVTGTFWQATQPVSGTFWQATQPISAASLPLPTNASTSAAEGSVAAGTAGTKSLLTGAVYNSSAPTLTTGQQVALQVDANGNLKTTATFTGSIGAVNQGTANTVGNAWPILVTDGTRTATIKAASTAATTSDLALVVALSPNTPSPATSGRNKVAQLYNDYTSTSVTTSAYTQLTASTASAVNKIEIFDSSGEALILAVGGAGSEIDQLYIFPGGNGPVDLAIPASSRISVKAKTATASAGFLAINLYS